VRIEEDHRPREPGDLVQIKSREEIVAALDKNNRNRGVPFDPETLKYFGRNACLQEVDEVLPHQRSATH
jgi:hypothetical protein